MTYFVSGWTLNLTQSVNRRMVLSVNQCHLFIHLVSVECTAFNFFTAKARDCFYRHWFVCLSVTTITKKIVVGFVPNFMGRFLGGREDQVCVSLQSVEGCGSNGQKTP